MKKAVSGHMNIPFNQRYNAEDDVYYVTFKTGEPSYCEEIDDALLLERGMYTKLPTGFRILNFHKNPVTRVAIGVLVRKIKQTLKSTTRDSTTTLRRRENQLEEALEKVLSPS